MRLLVVEDALELQKPLVAGLKKAGYAVDASSDGKDALWRIKSSEYDLIVLDIMLPGLDGLGVLKKLREAGKQTHVLLLTAKDTVEDRVRGLRSGADDYLVKPFAFDELLARIEALLRRNGSTKSPVLKVGKIEIDTNARSVRKNDLTIDLPPREFALLEYLVRHRGKVISRTEIEEHIYDGNAELMSNVVDSAIYSLRRKLDEEGKETFIHTRRGMGYIIEAEGK